MKSYPYPLTNNDKFASVTNADANHVFDRSKPRKYWADLNALTGKLPEDPYGVKVVDAGGNYVTACIITCAEAADLNIDGIPPFPQPAAGPTDVSLLLNGGVVRALIAPTDLIRDQDIASLTKKIMADTGVTPTWTRKAPLTDDGSGGSLTWRYFTAETMQSAGWLWNQMCLMGVGWPGKWSKDPQQGYLFNFAEQSVFEPDPNIHFANDPVPMPMEALLPGEFLIANPMPMGNGPWVQHAAISSSSPVTADDTAALAAITAKLDRIITRLGMAV